MVEASPASGEPQAPALGERILSYLANHPQAADTWKGVAAWWLDGGPWVAPEAVLAALEDLARRGQIAVRRLPSGESLFSAVPARTPGGPSLTQPDGQDHEDGDPRRE
jgi:hypothetical protein